MNRFSILLSAAFLLLGGCVTTDDQMNYWLGKNVNELIRQWGPPKATVSDDNGGQILYYNFSRQETIGGAGKPSSRSPWGGSDLEKDAVATRIAQPGAAPSVQNFHFQRTFWADSDGKIYRWAWRDFGDDKNKAVTHNSG